MKYQALKRLKTKRKLLKMCDTLQEAHDIIKAQGGVFREFSYIGGFPVYVSEDDKNCFSIQGMATSFGVVCSLDEAEKKAFDFTR